jgi:YD repeat-containing protein
MTDPLGNVYSFTYDVRDRLTASTDPKGQAITLAYDALSRRIALTTPDNAITMSYDAVGNPLTRFGYDGAGRMA